MSKAPAASSFMNPKRTGWLMKHGGSGISSHWKKRWFVVDDHHLFYYKALSDKKPVGILSLQEYGSCQKADVKEWKKPYPFVLERAEGYENTETGSPGKDYVLYSDSDEDMKLWIEVLNNEIKSSAACIRFSTANSVGHNNLKVDQKAIEEVTKAAGDGPKLTHLTAQRPRMKGRRPPKRYATYHEEDKDESPPGTPPSERKGSPVTNTPSPNASPTSTNKGYRPAVPLIPKQRSVTSSYSATMVDKSSTKLPTVETEITEVSPTPKQRPVPPRRPQKPRTSTDAPVAAPRPIPVPRKVIREETTPPCESESNRELTDSETLESHMLADTETTAVIKQETDQVENDVGDQVPTKVVESEMNVDLLTSSQDIDSKSQLLSSSEYEHMNPGITKKSTHLVASFNPELNTTTTKTSQLPNRESVPSVIIKEVEAVHEIFNAASGNHHSIVATKPQVSAESEKEHFSGVSDKATEPEKSDELKPFRIERDALGYTKVMKLKSNESKARSASPGSDEEPPPPPLWLGIDDGLQTNNVPSTLYQAREILRLAQVMKKEMEDMRREVQRELELARRERQDAELIKQNATEILRMAKQKLSQTIQ